MDDNFEGLNRAQLDAVTSTEGYVRVIAGAGSGKTRALSHRFAYLVLELGIMPQNILCVTFTNKAANEMRQRIRKLTGDNDTGYISTFHGFCVSVLQEDSNAVQYPKSFLVLDNSDIDQILKIIYEERGLTLRDTTFSKARDMIEIRKGITEPDYYEYMIAMSPDELKKKYDEAINTNDIIFYGYLYNEKKCFALDYNDLIFYTLYIFRNNPDVRLKWQKRLEYVMIDEFQDIDRPQYELMQVLTEYHRNLFIVGDPDQTIYTWRGANVKYILNFDEEFPNTKTIMMVDNYRSTPQILGVVNSLISKNHARVDKRLKAVLSDGPQVRYHHTDTDYMEAEFIVDEVNKLKDLGVGYSDIAVLYRAHYVTRALEEVFQRKELPYSIYSGVRFFDRMEIKDSLSYLRLIAYKDDLSFLRVANTPKRNIGEKRIRFLREFSEKNGCSLYEALCRTLDDEIFKNTKARRFVDMINSLSLDCFERNVSELLSDVLTQSGYEEYLRTLGSQERLDNLAELKQAVHEYEVNCGEEGVLESYLSHVALLTNNDRSENADAIKLMTVHSAKGLEFPYVFLVALSESIFPSKKTATIEGIEEERRLAFVACTRAEKALYLSDCEGKNIDGTFRYPSRFIFDIDKEVISYDQELKPDLIKGAHQYIENKNMKIAPKENGVCFVIGDRVQHPVFGVGNVIDIDMDILAYVIKFDNLSTVRNITFRAKLSPANDE